MFFMFEIINSLLNRKKVITANFQVSVEEQTAFLRKCNTPKDLLERSYNQYLCQRYLMRRSWISVFLIDTAALLISTIYAIYLVFKRGTRVSTSTFEAVYPYKGKYSGIIPLKYKQKYDIHEIEFGNMASLSFNDLIFVYKIVKKYPSQGYFILKNIYKIALYSDVFRKYKPKVIFCSSEYSFTSSILTEWCRRNDVLHVNIMHGEKLYTIRDSWFEFDVCSVWDIHYIELFNELQANIDQFEINIPESLQMNLANSHIKKYKLTYYLAGETEEILIKLKKSLLRLNFSEICIRIHPRYRDDDMTREIFDCFDIERPEEVTLKESFENTEYICSLYSTVLYQAFLNGKKVCIDDISYGKDKLNDLKNLRYIMMSKEIHKLSELCQGL